MIANGVLAVDWSDGTTVGYPLLFLGVLLGSIVPVVPTGAVVGVAAAFAVTSGHLALPIVLAYAVAGAVIGDVVTFAVCRFGGPRALARIARRQDPERIRQVREQFREHGWQIIVAGRLLPAGRIPVLLAAGALAYPWRRLLPATVIGATLWAVAYAALGVFSGGVFDSPLVATLLATLLVLVAGGVLHAVGTRRRRARAPHPDTDDVADGAGEHAPSRSARETP